MKIYSRILFVLTAFLLTQCLEPRIERVSYENTEAIEEKLKQLRELQRAINESGIKSTGYQADIQAKIEELNNLIAPGNIPITYSIGIVSAAGNQEQIGIANATVSINVRDERLTAVTDTDGQVVFENLRSGIVLVHIAVAGYTDASFVADLRVTPDDDYNGGNSGNPYNVTSAIALYPTTTANGAASIQGTLYYDPDRTDDVVDPIDPSYGIVNYFNDNTSPSSSVYLYRPAEKIDFVDNVEVSREKPTLDAREQTWQALDQAINIFAFVTPNESDYAYVPAGTAGHILLTVYEEMFVTGTSTAANGSYSLTIPAGVKGNNVMITFQEFAGVEEYIRATNLNTVSGTTTVTLREREVVFTAMYGEISNAPQVPGFYDGFLGYYTFDSDELNEFYTFLTERRAQRADFYFGARTRNE